MVPEHGLVWDGRTHVWVVPPVMGDLRVLLTSFPDPEADVTCTTTLAIPLNIDVRGGWGRKVGREGRCWLMGCHFTLPSCRNHAPFRE